MKRSILTMLVTVAALCAMTVSAQAHVGSITRIGCDGFTFGWTNFQVGPFDVNFAVQDQANGKAVTSPFVIAYLSGVSGSKFISAPAAPGVDFRKVTATWTVDHGGSASASAYVKCSTPPPVTTTVTTPGKTTTVTGPGSTVTTPGSNVTTPAQTVTVTVPGPTNTVTVTVPGPTTTVTTPGATRTKIVIRHKTKIVYRTPKISVKCPPGWNGSYSVGIGKKGLPVTTRCSQGKGVLGAGVTG